MTRSRVLSLTVVIPLLALAAAQLVPFGRAHTNPRDGIAVAFDSPATRDLARRACFDCHSNHTKWPWYASVAPMSWRIQNDVREGREKLNFTAFEPADDDMAEAAGEASETVTKGEMPPFDYRLIHPEARLTAAERTALANGLHKMFAAYAEEGHGR